MPKMREYLDLDGRHPQDIFAQLSGLNRQFPDRDYKLAFDLQPLREGGFRATVKYWASAPNVTRTGSSEMTLGDDSSIARGPIVMEGGSLKYFNDDTERRSLEAAVATEISVLEERLNRTIPRDEVLSNIKIHGLESAARLYNQGNVGDLLVEYQIGVFDLKELVGISATRHHIEPSLSNRLNVTVDFLKGLKEDGKLPFKYGLVDSE